MFRKMSEYENELQARLFFWSSQIETRLKADIETRLKAEIDISVARGYQEFIKQEVSNMTEARLDSLATLESERESAHNTYIRSEIDHVWRKLVGRLKHEIERVHLEARREIRSMLHTDPSSENDLRARIRGRDFF